MLGWLVGHCLRVLEGVRTMHLRVYLGIEMDNDSREKNEHPCGIEEMNLWEGSNAPGLKFLSPQQHLKNGLHLTAETEPLS